MPWRHPRGGTFVLQIMKMSLDDSDAYGQGGLGEVANNEAGRLGTGLLLTVLNCIFPAIHVCSCWAAD